MKDNLPQKQSEILIYQTEDGRTRIDVRLAEETVWLTQQLMADMFQTTKQNISLHIQHIYEEGELAPESTVKKYLTVRREGRREVSRLLDYYNLDMIISVGYRVKSHVATHFRIWATQRLREYIIKGFTSPWMTNASSRPAAATTLTNCWPASGTSAPRKKSSGARSWTFMPPASTTSRTPGFEENFSPLPKISCTGPPSAIQPPKSWPPLLVGWGYGRSKDNYRLVFI